jgi:hypothetical protein
MRRSIAAVTVAASLLAGGAAGTVLASPVIASAQTASSDSGSTSSNPISWVANAIKGLVDNGTINQSQADAVTEAVEAARPPHGGPGGPGEHGRRGPGLSVAASAIGIDESALRTELEAGKTIAQVAAEHNVDRQKVIDAIVAEMQTHLDADVASGKLTQAEADQRKADAATHAADMVDGKMPPRGPHGDHDGPPPADAAPASSTSGA